MPYAEGDLIDQLSALYWNRYHSPLFISETASTGSVQRRQRWLDDSVEAVQRVRSRGVPLIGYTWWPLFALVTWAYRQGRHPPQYYLKQMGLWDLDTGLERVPTTLVANFHQLVDRGCTAVGPLAPTSEFASMQATERDL
jgi:beta-glucosidase/6-phospho-beta-glucosidase/beta-galactosidase